MFSSEYDWLSVQIKMIVQFIAKTLFKKDTFEYDIIDEFNYTDTDLLYLEIMKLVEQQNICEAEDLLFEKLDKGNVLHLEIAMEFYEKIGRFSDDELIKSNFSKEEIMEGIQDILNIFNVNIPMEYVK